MNLMNVFSATLIHLHMTFMGVFLGCAVGLPMAIFLMKRPELTTGVFYVIDAIQTVPTLAMLTFIMLLFGLNNNTVVAAIFLYSLFPIVRNAYIGLTSIDNGIIRAGRGIGMNPMQELTMIRLPLAIPMILTGVRLAIVAALGIATTGVFIGAGGLGILIWRGIQTRNTVMMLSGAIPVSVLAIFFEYLLGYIDKHILVKKSMEVKT